MTTTDMLRAGWRKLQRACHRLADCCTGPSGIEYLRGPSERQVAIASIARARRDRDDAARSLRAASFLGSPQDVLAMERVLAAAVEAETDAERELIRIWQREDEAKRTTT